MRRALRPARDALQESFIAGIMLERVLAKAAKIAIPANPLILLVPPAGLEPARPQRQQILSLPRLPIPPRGQFRNVEPDGGS